MCPRTKLKNVYKNTKISNTQQDKITMSGMPTKITRHAKQQENTAHKEEKHQLMETNPETTRMTELVEKTIKSYHNYIACIQETRGKVEHVTKI